MLKASVTVPKLTLGINTKAVLRKAGTRAAGLIRKRLNKGVDSKGGKIPKAKESDVSKSNRKTRNKIARQMRKAGLDAKNVRNPRALTRTGELIKSVTRGKIKTGSVVDGDSISVGPKGKHSGTKLPNLSLAATLQKRGVFMELTPGEEAEVAKTIEAEIAKQLSKL